MKFCLYDTKQNQIILVDHNLPAVLSHKRRMGISVDVAVLPLLSKQEYITYPPSFRGEVNGRNYLLYHVPGILEYRYDRVIVQDENGYFS